MIWVIALVVLVAVTLGATLQRVSGMGVGLVVAPTVSALLGPVAGVTISNVASSVTALILLILLRRDIDWRRFAAVAPLLVVGSVCGAWVVRTVDRGILDVILGTSVLIAIAAALGMQTRLNATGWFPAVTSGAVAGFMNTTAGVAAPAMTVYAVASHWEQRSLAATLQPVFLLANLSSITTKTLFGATPGGEVSWWTWLLAVAGVPLGIGVGTWLARRLSLTQARRIAIVIAAAGGIVALTRGVTALVA